jgi:hypothetical protein
VDVKVVVLAAMVVVASPARAVAQWAVFDAANFHQSLLQLAADLRMLSKLDGPEWRSIGGLVAAGNAVMPAGAVGGVPGATRAYPTVERDAVAATLATLSGALASAELQRPSMASGTAQLDAIKGQLAGVQGTEGALELSSTVHVFSAEELVLLRQAVVAGVNAQSVYYGNELTSRAETDENLRALLQAMTATPVRRPAVSLRPGS